MGESESDVLVINTGYWGIAVTKGQKYNFQFHLFTKELENAVVKAVLLDSEEQIVASKDFQVGKVGSWNRYEGTLLSIQQQTIFVLPYCCLIEGKYTLILYLCFLRILFVGIRMG